MKFAVLTTVIAVFSASSAAEQSLWGQCGGKEWTGNVACPPNAMCIKVNDLFSQCIPATSTELRRRDKAESKSTAFDNEIPIPHDPSSRMRVRFLGSSIRLIDDPDYKVFTISGSNSASTTIDGIEVNLAGTGLKGGWYKTLYSRMVSHLGERLVSAGVTLENGGDITLSVKGLPIGKHTLTTWHNAWDKISDTAKLDISVNGNKAASNVSQSIRVDNIWEAANTQVTFNITSSDQTVEILFSPEGADSKAYLNGIEIDGPPIDNQVSFPQPAHRDERIQTSDGDVTASWRAPQDVSSPKYNVYLGTSNSTLESVAVGQSSTNVVFSDLDTLETYYWRVDVVSDGVTYIGRLWTFRLAQLAFPGAEGYGRFARGGRGGKVVKVTSLEDNTDPGTLRHALTVAKGPRIVVFDVAGVITTTSRMSVNDQYVTVAGQTAPGKGIVIQGYPLGLTGATDIIFRHVRVRPGKSSGETVDGMGMQGSNYAIFDRCSMGWAIDESFSSRSAYNITFQRNMISEPLNDAGHKNYPEGTLHGYSATISGDYGSFHHNLLAHAEGRSWSMGGGLDNDGNFAGKLDIRNNVVYNFGGRVTDGGAHNVNFVANLYKQGPASSLTFALKAQYEDGMPGTQQYYCSGNSMPGVFDEDSTQYKDDGTGAKSNIACWADVSISPAPTYQKFFDKPFFESYVETQSSTEAYKRVLSDSGASQPVQDDHDQRIIEETLNKTYTYTGSKTGKKGLIDDPNDAGGLESFPETKRPSNWDADDDGIADWWDGTTGGEGYTVIEGYLNFMADPHAFVSPSETVVVDLKALARGFTDPTFEVKGAKHGDVTVSGSKLSYKAGGKAGIDHLTVEVADEEGSVWSRPFGIAIFEGAN